MMAQRHTRMAEEAARKNAERSEQIRQQQAAAQGERQQATACLPSCFRSNCAV
eukprot:SAG22_NODE_1182_length_5233_cov_12.254188_6_plen_53_part_00